MRKRKFSRVDFRIEALIETPQGTIRGAVENLSLNGVFVRTQEKLAENTEAEIKLVLTGITPGILVTLNSLVVRTTDEGIAFTFQKIDLDSFTHLRNIVTFNTGNGDMVMDELISYIGEKMNSDAPR